MAIFMIFNVCAQPLDIFVIVLLEINRHNGHNTSRFLHSFLSYIQIHLYTIEKKNEN